MIEEEGFTVSRENENSAERFLDIVNNRDKLTKGDTSPVRTKGFVVIVRQAKSLAELQRVCVEHQSYNQCLTARFRIQSKPIFGTVLAAFVANIMEVLNQDGSYSDHLLPDLEDGAWQELQKIGFGRRVEQLTLPRDSAGELTTEWLREFNGILSDRELFGTGKRLILLAEIVDQENTLDEWQLAQRALFHSLPERFGLVLTGAPQEFALSADDPHFLEIDWHDQEVSSEQAAAYLVSSLQNDQPAEKDRLGVENYAVGIARLILHKGTRPLTIGIQAPWGKGKSSFMHFVDNALVCWAPANRDELRGQLEAVEGQLRESNVKLGEVNAAEDTEENKARMAEVLSARAQIEDKYQQIWQRMKRNALNNVLSASFNSWQYEDATQIWAGLASCVSRRIEQVMPMARQVKTRFAYAWQHRKTEFIVRLALPVFVAVLLGLGIFLGYQDEFVAVLNQTVIDKKLPQFLDLTKLFIPVGSGLFLFWFIVWRLLTILNPISKRMLEYVKMPSYREQMGYQHRVMADLKFMYQQLRAWKSDVRVVVFIDDLDRCSETKIMEVLQAIHLILGASDFFVLLGIDTEMLYRAIRSYYDIQSDEDSFPEFYLRKIIQLPFHLPEFSDEARFGLVRNLFSAEAQIQFSRLEEQQRIDKEIANGGIEEEAEELLPYDMSQLRELQVQELEPAEDTGVELQAYRDFGAYLDDNPRELKRLINVHRLVKILIQLSRPNMIWSQPMQRKLVKWLIFCSLWPELIDDVLKTGSEQQGDADCISLTADEVYEKEDDRRGQLNAFAICVDTNDIITADELKPSGDFHLAANLSHLIREQKGGNGGRAKLTN